MTPLSKFLLVSTVGKITAVLILSYAFIINTLSAYDVSKKLDVSLFSDSNFASNETSNIRTNIICSYIFSMFILLLILMIAKKMVFVKNINNVNNNI
jgi:hypothetical protein